MMTYELKDRNTRETVCFFSARTFREAVETYQKLDPKMVFTVHGFGASK